MPYRIVIVISPDFFDNWIDFPQPVLPDKILPADSFKLFRNILIFKVVLYIFRIKNVFNTLLGFVRLSTNRVKNRKTADRASSGADYQSFRTGLLSSKEGCRTAVQDISFFLSVTNVTYLMP